MKSSPFQIILIALFGFFIIVGMVALYFTKGKETTERKAVEIAIWGTAPQSYIREMIAEVKSKEEGLKITYTQFTPESFDQSLIEALASSRGPDAVIISHQSIIRLQDKIYAIPYTTLTQRSFLDQYVGEAELFLAPWGVVAIPFSIDPLVAYWNRDIFNTAGLASPPKYWDEFITLPAVLTKKTENGDIKQSAVALGEYSNVTHAKAIISALLMQAGSYFAGRDENGRLGNKTSVSLLTNVLDFYTEFANPVKKAHSWSRSFPDSLTAFSNGDVGVYFGLASDLWRIRAINPNLDFDVTYFPVPRQSKTNVTYGDVLGVATLKASKNPASAMKASLLFGSEAGVSAWSKLSGLPPVRRSLLSKGGSGVFSTIFYNSALWSKGWLDPDPRRTGGLFLEMVENVTSGWMTTGQAVNKFYSQLSNMLSGS